MLSYYDNVVSFATFRASTDCIPLLLLPCHFLWRPYLIALLDAHLYKVVICYSNSTQMTGFHTTSQTHQHIQISCNRMAVCTVEWEPIIFMQLRRSSNAQELCEFEMPAWCNNHWGNVDCINNMSILLFDNIVTENTLFLRNCCQRKLWKHK